MTAAATHQDLASMRVRAALDLGRPQEALRLLAPLLAAEPNNARWWILLSKAHHDAGEYAAALKATETALHLAPHHSVAQYYRGLALWNANVRGRNVRRRAVRAYAEQAQAALREALRLDPFGAGYHVTLARLLLQTKDQTQAEDHLRQALKLEPDFSPALLALAELALKRRDVPEAERLARQVLAQEPESVTGLGILAWAQLRGRAPHQALRTALDAVRMAPADPVARAHFEALSHAYLPRPLARNSWVWRAATVPQVGAALLPLLAAVLGIRNVWRYWRLPPDLRSAVARVRPLLREQGAVLAVLLGVTLVGLALLLPNRTVGGRLLMSAGWLFSGVLVYWLGRQLRKRGGRTGET
ncbi:tetratricopeptide repeat protein [Deinococcus hopiensis]|uniref:Tfp pilus assembly protein PilF n=1 Tax=Deinococcus hopiensis KR-140 TaxID=695939 RepID=A0A1W1VWL0_9DEIO|nr:tetratricopeptide repeat protein [Deinococcus hopiensis]SMB97274.1 Tfp pilus assembly protein PilF [Deinococcus hopiensis KR-140]